MGKLAPSIDDDPRSLARRLASSVRSRESLSRRDYSTLVAILVAAIVAKRVISEFELYSSCQGAFPTIVKESLQVLGNYRRRIIRTSHDIELPADPAPWEHDDFDIIESEWYFDVPSVDRILSLFPAGAKSIVCLGVPTLAEKAGAGEREVTLVDRSPSLRNKSLEFWQPGGQRNVNVVQYDLNEKPYHGAEATADVVVMDPPWYIEHYTAWLSTAVHAVRRGGLIAVALPQLLTKRRASAERDQLHSMLKDVGRVRIVDDALSYVTPSFERTVLGAEGLGHLDRWRRGDLALVTVDRPAALPFTPVPESLWKYRLIDGRVVRSWGEHLSTPAMPVIRPANGAAGYQLTSVGRTYLLTNEINFVTSRGKAAVVHTWGKLPDILTAIEHGTEVKKAVHDADLGGVSAVARDELAVTIDALLAH